MTQRTSDASVQAPAAVVMIRPHQFRVNSETAADNAFQRAGPAEEGLAACAYREVTEAAARLTDAGIRVHLFEDEGDRTPDSVFPNNWFSTHAGGHVALYPMKAPSRRRERRADVIEFLKATYRVQDVIDYSGLEQDGLYLEGTGAMVLDHIGRIAFAARSDRTDPILLERFCTHFNYEPMVFDARDGAGRPIYHTNVLMCIATGFALVGLEMIADPARRAEIVARLEETGRAVIALDAAQIARFAGNAIELQGRHGRVLALSTTALAALGPAERRSIGAHAALLALDIPTIERAGGSVRCTLAGIHLTRRPAPVQNAAAGA